MEEKAVQLGWANPRVVPRAAATGPVDAHDEMRSKSRYAREQAGEVDETLIDQGGSFTSIKGGGVQWRDTIHEEQVITPVRSPQHSPGFCHLSHNRNKREQDVLQAPSVASIHPWPSVISHADVCLQDSFMHTAGSSTTGSIGAVRRGRAAGKTTEPSPSNMEEGQDRKHTCAHSLSLSHTKHPPKGAPKGGSFQNPKNVPRPRDTPSYASRSRKTQPPKNASRKRLTTAVGSTQAGYHVGIPRARRRSRRLLPPRSSQRSVGSLNSRQSVQTGTRLHMRAWWLLSSKRRG